MSISLAGAKPRKARPPAGPRGKVRIPRVLGVPREKGTVIVSNKLKAHADSTPEMRGIAAALLNIPDDDNWVISDVVKSASLCLCHYVDGASATKYGHVRGYIIDYDKKVRVCSSYGATQTATTNSVKDFDSNHNLIVTDDTGEKHVFPHGKYFIKAGHEGVVIRVFKHGGIVYHATHKSIAADKAKWGSDSPTFLSEFHRLGGPSDDSLFPEKEKLYSPICFNFMTVTPDLFVGSKEPSYGYVIFIGVQRFWDPASTPQYPSSQIDDIVDEGKHPFMVALNVSGMVPGESKHPVSPAPISAAASAPSPSPAASSPRPIPTPEVSPSPVPQELVFSPPVSSPTPTPWSSLWTQASRIPVIPVGAITKIPDETIAFQVPPKAKVVETPDENGMKIYRASLRVVPGALRPVSDPKVVNLKNISVEEANTIIQYGFHQPPRIPFSDDRLYLGGFVIVFRVSDRGHVDGTIKLQSSSYAWRQAMRANSHSILEGFFRNSSLSSMKVSDRDFAARIPALPPISDDEKTLSMMKATFPDYAIGPGPSIASVPTTPENRLKAIHAATIAATTTRLLPNAIDCYQIFLEVRGLLVKYLISLNETKIDTKDYPIPIVKAMEFISENVIKYSESFPVQARKYVFKQDGKNMYRLFMAICNKYGPGRRK